jgi:hypothetical protein
MRVMAALIVTVLVLLTYGSVASESAEIQGGYSTEPLRKPIFDTAKVYVETTAFNNWLVAKWETLDKTNLKGFREHLFYIIGSYVADLHAREGVVYPAEKDLVLETLYSWSERLEVFGGHLIYNTLKRDSSPVMEPSMVPPEGIEITLEGDVLSVRSPAEHWSVRMPYYFMVWLINDFTTTNGVRTQLVTLSTAPGRHKGQDGHSQATIMFIFSPGAEFDEFKRFWSEQLQITPKSKVKQLPVNDLSSQQRFDKASNMYTEFTCWQTERGPVGVSYMGINGTFQSNRVNFLDFLRSVSMD